jgi:hypothetical protein
MKKRNSKSRKLKPLNVTCTSSDCQNNLHCFKKSREMAKSELGQCRSCGVNLIDWQRVHRRDVNDAAFVFSSLKNELIRHHYWHKAIDQKAENHARRKGSSLLRVAVRNRLVKSLSPQNPYDGRQTPPGGNIIYYAQHALACCCRKCLEYWHGIPMSRPLYEDEVEYFTSLVMMFINERLPDLAEAGIKIPSIRQRL